MAIGGKTLTVYLAADVSKLRSGLNSADRSLSGFGDKLNRMVGPALIGAAAAAGTFAVALAVDGVQAAIQEEAELAKLSTTLNNLGFAEQTDEVNSFIDELQYSAAVSDSTLRPAYSRLLTLPRRKTSSSSPSTSAQALASPSRQSLTHSARPTTETSERSANSAPASTPRRSSPRTSTGPWLNSRARSRARPAQPPEPSKAK